MNQAYVHLALNHVPVVGTGIGLLVLIFALWRRMAQVVSAALGIFVLCAVAAIPTYLSGEPAEEVIEEMPGVSEPAIEEHEEAAKLALAAVELLGLFAAAGLFLSIRRGALPGWLPASTLVVALVAADLLARTANLGGRIRHPEVRAGFDAGAEGAAASHEDD